MPRYGSTSYRAGRAYGYGSARYRAGGGYGYGSYGYRASRGYGYGPYGYRGGYRGYSSMIRPYFSRSYIRPYGWRPYYSFRFARPYYVFSPWLSLGFGLWAGYPVSYPWTYLGAYRPTVFGAVSVGSYQALPGSSTYVDANAYADPNAYADANASGDASAYGGASFDIQPADANLFVDDQYVGVVGNFGPTSEPLTLAPGQHRIAVQKDGYRPMEWDVTVEPGQVVPYRGVLERQ